MTKRNSRDINCPGPDYVCCINTSNMFAKEYKFEQQTLLIHL